MVKKSIILKVAVPMVVIGMLASCNSKPGGSSKKSSASDYPVVEMSEGLAKAAQAYSQVYEFHDGYAKVRGGDFYGMIDKDGNLVVPCDYASLTTFGKILLATKSLHSRSWGVIDTQGNVVVPLKFGKDDIVVFPKEELVRVKKSEVEYDFFDFQGKDLFPQGLFARRGFKNGSVVFSEGLAAAILDKSDLYQNPYGFVDKTGKVVIQAQFKNPARFDNGMAWVDNTFLINTNGKVLMEVKTDGSLKGLVKSDGTEVIPCQFKDFEVYENGLLVTIGGNNLYGLWNILEGKEIISPIYDEIDYEVTDYSSWGGSLEFDGGWYACRRFIKHGLIEVKKNNRYGLIDVAGKEILPCDYERSYYIKVGENSILTTIDITPVKSIHTLYTLDGTQIMSERESVMGLMSEGLVAVMKNDGSYSYGYYDENGDEVIAPKYEEAGMFSEGIAPVQLKATKQWGYVNHAGKDTFGEHKETEQ